MKKIQLMNAAEVLADAVEDFLFTTEGTPEKLRGAWDRYVNEVDEKSVSDSMINQEDEMQAEVRPGDVPDDMPIYRCSYTGVVVRFNKPDLWTSVTAGGPHYRDAEVKGWAVCLWTTPFEECEPYYPLHERSHAADVAELIALRRQVKELQEAKETLPHEQSGH